MTGAYRYTTEPPTIRNSSGQVLVGWFLLGDQAETGGCAEGRWAAIEQSGPGEVSVRGLGLDIIVREPFGTISKLLRESSGGSTVIIPLEGALFRSRRHEVANIGSASRPSRIPNTIPNQHLI
ncbi:hypothetical protein J6590_016873 [Homalodisca vitripennis]|nr:hypothetical protein J6590_016873 [Homalodisca vitripennis]